MKILLTGPNSTSGKAIIEKLTDYEFVTCPHSDYDLTNNDDLAKVGTSQSILLHSVYNNWVNRQKTGKIISFGTLGTVVSYQVLTQLSADNSVIASKLLLEKVHSELSFQKFFGTQPQSVLIRFANFESFAGRDQPYTTKQQLADIINFILKSDTYISTMDFREI